MNGGAAVIIPVKGRCDLRCLFCNPGGDAGADDSAEHEREVLEALAAARREGRDRVVFGAFRFEPLTHPGIGDLIAAARAAGFRSVGVATSGVRAADRAFARDLRRRGLTEVIVTLFAGAPRTAAEIAGRDDALDLKWRAIDNCMAEGVAARINVLLIRPALAELPDIFAACAARARRDRAPAALTLSFPAPTTAAAAPELTPPYTAAVGAIARALPSLGPGPTPEVTGIPPCLAPAAPRDGWSNRLAPPAGGARYGVAAVAACANCARRAACDGVPRAYLDLYGDGEFHGQPPRDVALQSSFAALRRILTTRAAAVADPCPAACAPRPLPAPFARRLQQLRPGAAYGQGFTLEYVLTGPDGSARLVFQAPAAPGPRRQLVIVAEANPRHSYVRGLGVGLSFEGPGDVPPAWDQLIRALAGEAPPAASPGPAAEEPVQRLP